MPHLTEPGALAPDPPEAPMPSPTGTVTLTTAMGFGELLSVARQAESYLATNDAAREGWKQLHKVDPAAACKPLATDVQSRQDAWEAERLAAYGGGRGAPLDPREVERLARKYGLHDADAVALAYAEQELAAVRAEHQPPASDVPWLDARPLSTPPEPWNEAHWQRDERRAQAAGIELNQPAWQAYAEQGQDGVTEILSARRDHAVGQAEAERDNVLQVGRERAAIEAAEQARRERAANGEPEPAPRRGYFG